MHDSDEEQNAWNDCVVELLPTDFVLEVIEDDESEEIFLPTYSAHDIIERILRPSGTIK